MPSISFKEGATISTLDQGAFLLGGWTPTGDTATDP